LDQFHIVIVCKEIGGTGSVASVAFHHATELVRYCNVTVVSDTLPAHTHHGMTFVKIRHRHFLYLRRYGHVPNEYSFATSARRQIETLHQNYPVHMLFCHSHALAALAGIYLKKRCQIPYALITHADIFERPRGTYDWRLTAFYRVVTPYAYRNADFLLALSPYMASCAQKKGADQRAIHIIPNGIVPRDIGLDIETDVKPGFKKGLKSKPAESLNLLFVGMISKTKGTDVLIDACNIMSKKNIRFNLQIIGEGPLKNKLRIRADKANLTNNISFLNNIPRQLLSQYYQAADIVCVPSLNEPFGLVVLEALVSGTPVIASDTGGIPYMIKRGFNGILIPPGDPEALANAVEILYKDFEKLNKLGSNAYMSVFPSFSWHHIGKLIYEIITKTVTLKQDKFHPGISMKV